MAMKLMAPNQTLGVDAQIASSTPELNPQLKVAFNASGGRNTVCRNRLRSCNLPPNRPARSGRLVGSPTFQRTLHHKSPGDIAVPSVPERDVP